MLSNEVMCFGPWLRAEQPLNGLHGCDQTVLFCGREFAEQRGDLIACARIERSEFFLTFLRQTEMALSAIDSRRRPADQSAFLEAAEDAAQVSRIQIQFPGEFRRSGTVAVREFVKHAHFGQ